MVDTWTTDEIQIVAKQVCMKCNNEWMNDLENEAKPYLTPMIQGRGKHLHQHGQAIVAAWAVKTALALHLTTPEKAATPAHYREITRTNRAPRETRV